MTLVRVFCWPGALPLPPVVTSRVAVKAYQLGFQSRLAAQINRDTGNPFGGAVSELSMEARNLWYDGWQDADDWLFIWESMGY